MNAQKANVFDEKNLQNGPSIRLPTEILGEQFKSDQSSKK